MQTAHSSAHLHDNTSLTLLLTRLSTLLRSALRSLGGEEPDVDLSTLLNLDFPAMNGTSDDSGSAPPSPTKSISSGKKSSSSGGKKSVIQRAPPRQPRFPGFAPGSSGGYAGTNGQGDWALEREMEILRLEEENDALRELLAIAEESPAAQAVEEEIKEAVTPPSPTMEGQGRRKSSLTVEELSAGAEMEEAEKERAVEAGLVDKEGNLLARNGGEGEGEPGTGLGGGNGIGQGNQRPVLEDGALGITARVSPEHAIDDAVEL